VGGDRRSHLTSTRWCGLLAPDDHLAVLAELADVLDLRRSVADMLRVLVSDWQMESFRHALFGWLARSVDGVREIDTDWLSRALGEAAAATIDYIDDRTPNPTLIIISGSVARIEAVQCEFATHAEERGLWPVPGTEKVENVAYAARWVPDEPPRRFAGWVVGATAPLRHPDRSRPGVVDRVGRGSLDVGAPQRGDPLVVAVHEAVTCQSLACLVTCHRDRSGRG